ncbi:hypothetical protein [Winogradskyella arenosi]|uniref:Uncharacterized protein n=1 Tax=Winogradskyella arenosi TaxID=533325 RepID=A0A368ZEP9_9FLAO|nr:hypothetical protein [Winogradskyella arenosi]RCW92006.1 hypothetical protein DFQ08_10225 [Winogradskyella arenosi]
MTIKPTTPYYYASIILYGMALTQNAFLLNNEDGQYGYLTLIFGFYAVLDTGISWLANVLILLSWAYRDRKAALYFSVIALGLGISFLAVDNIVMGTHNQYGKITGYDTGYYLWVLSFLVMTIGQIVNYKKQLINTVTPKPS